MLNSLGYELVDVELTRCLCEFVELLAMNTQQGTPALVIHADIILPDLHADIRVITRLVQKEGQATGLQIKNELLVDGTHTFTSAMLTTHAKEL